MLVHSSEWKPMIQNLQLRELCKLILDTTIDDANKYQSGKTKIFFRPGMLAALESLRGERLNSMVTIVQKNMRRYMAMKHYRRMRVAAIKIQTWWRGIAARKLVEQIRRTTAVTRLQRAARRYIHRKRFLDIRQGVILIQSRESAFSCHRRVLCSLISRHPWSASAPQLP